MSSTRNAALYEVNVDHDLEECRWTEMYEEIICIERRNQLAAPVVQSLKSRPLRQKQAVHGGRVRHARGQLLHARAKTRQSSHSHGARCYGAQNPLLHGLHTVLNGSEITANTSVSSIRARQ